MLPADGLQSTSQDACASDGNSCAGSNREETPSEVEATKESGLYRFVQIQSCPDHNGSNEGSPRPSLQSMEEMYSRSLNDVSSLMNQSTSKETDSQV